MEKTIETIFSSSVQSPILIIGYLDYDLVCSFLKIGRNDFFYLKSGELKIEKIRELIHWIQLKPAVDATKLVYIDDSDELTIEASNALLKTLEEPPNYIKIVLVTKNEKKILPTIISRCQKYRVPVSDVLLSTAENLSPAKLSQISYVERFKEINLLLEQEDFTQDKIDQVLVSWQAHFREKMLQGENTIGILEKITVTRDLLLTNISVKLLLENLVINF